MSEKVKLTKAQAEAIERHASKEDLLKSKLVGLLEHGLDEPIDEMTVEELARALYIGYEVEETFEVGDWVVYKHTRSVFKVIDVREKNGDVFITVDDENYKQVNAVHFHHATPEEIAEEKQRRWWAKHGREVWELREGDLLEGLNDMTIIEFLRFDQGALEYRIRSSYYREDILGYEKRYRVICFAEDRKDVEYD